MTAGNQKGGALAKLAAIFCEQSLFRAFLNEKLPDPHLHIGTAEQATEHLKMVCNVKSRIEFDNDPEAERRFHDLVRIPYVHWQLSKDSE
nr:MAG TPA: hypothetical protein [Caudoviricetes sp.]